MTAMAVLGILAVSFLSFSNGANDNFKGVATLLGSRTAGYRVALAWATMTTFLGSVAAVFMAQKLIANFSGKGLVPDTVVHMPAFMVSVSFAAAVTVYAATRWGFPISTTHALTGGLVGAGLAAVGEVSFDKLLDSFFVPLVTGPVVAFGSALVIYPIFHWIRRKAGITAETCLCVGREFMAVAPAAVVPPGVMRAALQIEGLPQVVIDTKVSCVRRYRGEVFGLEAKGVLDGLHFASSGLMSFARGLNDTPKIAAAFLLLGGLSPEVSLVGTGLIIALGGWILAERIAHTMSYKITNMNEGQGLTANLVTSAVVLGASHLGLPVSTTHVSCGALFGIGTATRRAMWSMVAKIVMAWITTLPLSAALGAIIFLGVRHV